MGVGSSGVAFAGMIGKVDEVWSTDLVVGSNRLVGFVVEGG